ncbi:TIGR02281 family clan AA aspartic protease [Rubrivivax rivuli]|uniref:TIGR02281 family clan AA aspartic protease n=2 Tax=Rubrivivax rivuli TaxID=1862385 RepID=A0A437RIV5_9BURK|nr:TIGR02281 family clan AA aspartic protease [Rubrivivax rivuli]
MTALRTAAAALLLAVAGVAQAQLVVLSGRMGEKALLVVDGQPYTVAVGQTVAGVKLLRWEGDVAQVERAGRSYPMRVGETPVLLGVAPPRSAAREIVLTAGSGGHFTAAGSINGKQVRFMVDTGATLVSLGKDDAERLGLDLSNARRGTTQTANGPVPVWLVTLNTVRVGEVELSNVGAAVVPQAMPMVLLGNSFLSRMSMKREADVMRLELR